MRIWFLVLVLLGLSSALVCPDGGMCEDRNTCCKNTVGGYGCCPLPHAECCSDHLHCCFEGTVCDLVQRRCVNRTVSLPWISALPVQQALLPPPPPPPPLPQLGDEEGAGTIVCPDQESTCSDDSTCCELPDGSWGCCPLRKAVCCDDKQHCCPEATKCDPVHDVCTSASLASVPMLRKLPARRRLNHTAPSSPSVTCPGGTKICPDTFTCCLLSSGDYGCCPYSQAVCCSDHAHCCPSGTTCDLEHGMCQPAGGAAAAAAVPLPLNEIHTDVVCPDKTEVCPDQTTCCQMTNGSYGCCPMPNAVCCSDHIHCCPAGTECDLALSTCVSTTGGRRVTVAQISAGGAEPVAAKSKVGAVRCNDTAACADGSTCCKTASGEWACCPLPQAVCCKDHIHCCPQGTICNLAASTCDDPKSNAPVLPWYPQVPAIITAPAMAAAPATVPAAGVAAVALPADNTKCDKSTSCPGKSTCCMTGGEAWACCPLPEAVCCDDHVHCCPHGSVCNLEAETCDSAAGGSRPLARKVAAEVREDRDEKCDRQSMCPGGTTCCRKSSGQWACCPLPQGVCCSDQEHCCPKGYKCNVEEQTCDRAGARSLRWLHAVPALRTDMEIRLSDLDLLDKNMCDPQTTCPRDTTCCFMDTSHKWGCCPLPNAVCCQDGNHCCPSGHTCEPHRSSCSRGPHRIPWFTKVAALTTPTGPDALTDVKCDDQTSCASGTTCCQLLSGEWGCCPLVKAVCCADHEHCCPQGYTCNMETGTCEKKSEDQLLQNLPQTKVLPLESEKDVVCDVTGTFRCPETETCCRATPTEWACCPLPKAVCCADLKHCCPAGFSCDPESGGCVRPERQLTWDRFFGERRRDLVPGGL